MADVKSQKLRDSILRYQTDVRGTVERLEASLKQQNLLRAVRAGTTPAEGNFGKDNQEYYSFHGTGCFIESADISFDFEFDKDGLEAI